MRRGIGEVTAFAIATMILLVALLYVVLSLGTMISSIAVPMMKGSTNEALTVARVGDKLYIRNSGAITTKISDLVVMELDLVTGSTRLIIVDKTYTNCSISKTLLAPGDIAIAECISSDNEVLIPIGVITSSGNIYLYKYIAPGGYIDLITNNNIRILWYLFTNGTYASWDATGSKVCYTEIYITKIDTFEASYVLVLSNGSNGLDILASNSTHRLLVFNLTCSTNPRIVLNGEDIYHGVGVYMCKQLSEGKMCTLDLSECTYDDLRLYRVVPLGTGSCVQDLRPFTIYGDLDNDGMLELVIATTNDGVYVDGQNTSSDQILDSLQGELKFYGFVIEGPRYEYLNIYLHIYFWTSRGCNPNTNKYNTTIEIALINIATGQKVASTNVTYGELCYEFINMTSLKPISIKKTLSIPQQGFYNLAIRIYDPYSKDVYNDVEYILSIERVAVLLYVRT